MERSNSSSSSSSSSQDLNMQQLLQDPRYGTPLFEAFVLPADTTTAAAGLATAAAAAASDQLPDSAGSVESSVDEESISSSIRYTSQIAALQSVQRAMNEVLRVVPILRPASSDSSSSSSSSQQPPVRVTNQRIMVLIDGASSAAFAASVSSGSDSTLLVWRMLLADAPSSEQQQQQQQPGTTSWPARPAESGNGAFRTTFTLDWWVANPAAVLCQPLCLCCFNMNRVRLGLVPNRHCSDSPQLKFTGSFASSRSQHHQQWHQEAAHALQSAVKAWQAQLLFGEVSALQPCMHHCLLHSHVLIREWQPAPSSHTHHATMQWS
jgi:hypothetical protein